MINTKIWEAALDRLHVKYRMNSMTDGRLFFCRFPNELSFDLQVRQDGSFRLWRFIRSDMPKERKGMSLTCRSSKGLGAVIGLEVTDELDLNCYVEQTIDTSCWENAESLIEKYLSGFSHLIARLDLKCRKQKFLWS